MPSDAVYSLTKHAVVGFVRSVAPQLAPIRINAVCPGIADTPMIDAPARRVRGCGLPAARARGGRRGRVARGDERRRPASAGSCSPAVSRRRSASRTSPAARRGRARRPAALLGGEAADAVPGCRSGRRARTRACRSPWSRAASGASRSTGSLCDADVVPLRVERIRIVHAQVAHGGRRERVDVRVREEVQLDAAARDDQVVPDRVRRPRFLDPEPAEERRNVSPRSRLGRMRQRSVNSAPGRTACSPSARTRRPALQHRAPELVRVVANGSSTRVDDDPRRLVELRLELARAPAGVAGEEAQAA